jgi:hypothetical protein
MVDVVQLVRASDCGSECRGFESHLPPRINPVKRKFYGVSCFCIIYSSLLQKDFVFLQTKSIIYIYKKERMNIIVSQEIETVCPNLLALA